MEEQLSLFDFHCDGLVCGCDEAGRGPLAGPVAAAACILPQDFDFSILNDSKKLSEKQRLEAEAVIRKKAAAFSIVFINAQEIDEINILQATMKAMKLCYEEIRAKEKISVFYVDGNRKPDIRDTEVEAVIRGDGKIPSIMAASILAKTARDRLMLELDRLYPQYGFARNKGYGTKEHYAALQKYGPCPEHRRTFLRTLSSHQGKSESH